MVNRNNIAKNLCNLVLKYVATEDYRTKVDLLIKQGMYHAEHGNGPYIVRNDDK